MGEKKYVNIYELCELKNLKPWRVYDMTRKGQMPVKHIAGKPIIPYQIDLHEFEKLESTAAPSQGVRSVKTKENRVQLSHRKENLWQK